MNSRLLQHYIPLSSAERRNIELLRSGQPFIANNTLSDRKSILMANGFIDVYRECRYIVQECEHTHNHVEIAYAFSGDSCHIVNGERISMRPGELLLLNQRARHKTPTLNEGDVVIYFNCLPQFFSPSLELLGSESTALRKFLGGCMYSENPQAENDFIHFKVGSEYQVQNLVKNLLYALTFSKQNIGKTNQATMALLMLHLAHLMGNEEFDAEQSALAAEVMAYIEERFVDGSLNDLARRLSYEMNRLSKNIKQLTGSNFSELMQSKRISHAKSLLEITDLSTTEIARRVGYNNVTFFYRLFRDQVGCSPGDYRVTME